MMITIVTVWLCLITHVACDVLITVNNNGSDTDKCCVNGTCPCSSLLSALHNVSDNTVINITSESVTLHDIVGMGLGNLNNITITGNGATIMCNNTGGVYCESCSNITIMGITWYQCGRNDPFRALAFIHPSSEVLIQHCTFQNCPVYIRDAKGKVSIEESNFITYVFDFSCSYSTCIGLYISYDADIVVTINNSKFNGSGCTDESGYDCNGVWIEPSNDVFKFNRFLFKNTNFSNYDIGLNLRTSDEKAVIELFNVYVYNNDLGVNIQRIQRNGSTNDSSSIVYVLSATFINNYDGALVVDHADTVNISSATFINNTEYTVSSAYIFANTVSISSATFILSSYNNFIQARTVNVLSCVFIRNPLIIHIESDVLSINISNSCFYNNSDTAISIQIHNRSVCAAANITFTNITIYETSNNYPNAAPALYVDCENTILSIMLKSVSFMSNYVKDTLFIKDNKQMDFCQSVSIQLTNCTFYENFALDHVVAMNIIGNENIRNDGDVTIELHDCGFDHNFGGKSIVYVYVYFFGDFRSMILDNSTFSNNKGTALHLFIFSLVFEGDTLFINNSATNGAAVYLEKVQFVSSDDNANVQFINNSADQKGGAMYIDLVSLDFVHCDVFQRIPYASNISFSNNSAVIAGNSIYFNVAKDCQVITDINNKSSLLYYPNMFKYFEKSIFTKTSPVVTSPYNIKLYPPAIAICNSDNDYFLQGSKMLGEPIQITASVFDYFNNITEPVTFSVNCKTCGSEYILSTYLISVHNQSMYELKILPTVAKDVVNNANISITLLSALSSIYRQINASLSIELSSCRAGYLFDFAQGQCVCYPHSGLVHCKGYFVEIKIGYLTKEHYTSSICPNNYCSSEYPETSPGYYRLHGKPDNQCSSHRTGVGCGECKSGYTLAYDSPDCINTDKCSAGMTILVIVLTILYWIAIVAVVFGLMYFQFQISSGYAYGIIYYYSIVDVLLVNDVSEEVSQLVNILSSFAKLTPQLFGQLCFVRGLSGIDQQFIHYSHALAVSLILLIIVLMTRYSPKLTRFVGRCIIRVICILLLLSYTCLASTSLQLLRPLTFNDVDEVRTYSSPDIKYFTGRSFGIWHCSNIV